MQMFMLLGLLGKVGVWKPHSVAVFWTWINGVLNSESCVPYGDNSWDMGNRGLKPAFTHY